MNEEMAAGHGSDWRRHIACLFLVFSVFRSIAAVAQPSVLPDPLSLGFVEVGSSNSDVVQLRNFTGAALAIVSIESPQAPFQLVSSNCQPLPFTLNNLDTCALEYRFDPSSAGTFSESLEVVWQAGSGNSGSVFINLAGTGTEPELTITPDPLDFGQVLVNSVGGPLTVTLTNTGQADLDVQAIDSVVQPFSFVGGDCPQPPFSLPPNVLNSCSLDLEFSPVNTGVEVQQLSVTSNAGGPSDSINLEGRAGVDGTSSERPEYG